MWIVNDATVNGSETGSSFKQALYFKEIGFRLHDTMIWRKDTSSFPESVRYFQVFEYMFIFSKDKPRAINLIKDRKNKYVGTKIHGTIRNADGTTTKRGDKWSSIICADYGTRFNVWDIPTEKINRTGHPAVFPEKLAEDHILSWSNEGDVVMDPFMGSGTTGKMCLKNNREFIGIEMDEGYFTKAKERLEKYET